MSGGGGGDFLAFIYHVFFYLIKLIAATPTHQPHPPLPPRSCVPNPQQCGGTGQCSGGTAELAYATLNGTGLSSEWTYPYLSYFGQNFDKCDTARVAKAAPITGYVHLPTNELAPLLNAITTLGPIAISVEASHWSAYEEGVFDGCNQTNPDIDHAVVLVGYGTDATLGDYFLIRNSWSPQW